MITPALVQQYGLPIEPRRVRWGMYQSAWVCHPAHASTGIAGYDEDAVFLVVPNESELGWIVPLVIGNCMISRIINVN